jgi:RNA polymerase sigma factor (sigma-70 family)
MSVNPILVSVNSPTGNAASEDVTKPHTLASDQPLAVPTDADVDTQDIFAEAPEAAETPELDPALKARYDQLFEQEMMPHLRSLYHFAYRLSNDEDDANDLVQDTYLKAYRFIKSYEQGSNAKAWLFRILKNSFINNYRKQSKEPNKIDYEEAETFLQTGKAAYSDSIDGREKMFHGMIGDEVTKALTALPVDFRTVIILCDIEEFTYEEIAKIIDIPIGTVRSRLHRARKMLRDALLDYALSMGYDAD